MNKKASGYLILALLGAVIATVGDAIHVHTHTLSYPSPFLLGQAWWVFPGFTLTFLFMANAYTFIIGRLPAAAQTKESMSGGSMRETIEASMAFLFVYMLTGFANFEPGLLSVIIYCAFAVRLAFTYDRLWLLLLAVLLGAGGMFVEGAMAQAGWVTYRYTDIFNVPLWLGGLYMHGAFALREGVRWLVYGSR